MSELILGVTVWKQRYAFVIGQHEEEGSESMCLTISDAWVRWMIDEHLKHKEKGLFLKEDESIEWPTDEVERLSMQTPSSSSRTAYTILYEIEPY
jgi:hypothetical protein